MVLATDLTYCAFQHLSFSKSNTNIFSTQLYLKVPNEQQLVASSFISFEDQPIPTKGVYLPPYLSSKLNTVSKVHTLAWDKDMARC